MLTRCSPIHQIKFLLKVLKLFNLTVTIHDNQNSNIFSWQIKQDQIIQQTTILFSTYINM